MIEGRSRVVSKRILSHRVRGSFSKASTIRGSNCVPSWLRISSRAAAKSRSYR